LLESKKIYASSGLLEKKDHASLKQPKDPSIVMHIAVIWKIKYNVLMRKACLLIRLNLKNTCKTVPGSEISKKKKKVFGIISLLIKITNKHLLLKITYRNHRIKIL